MNMFEDIGKVKKDLPKVKTVFKNVKKTPFNFYQIIAIIIGALSFIIGIVFGNLFPACGSTASFYSDICLTTEFNFSLMILIWFVSFLLCLFIFAIGHIIALLSDIREKMN